MEGKIKRRVVVSGLPKEMIEEILSRLPVKSLLRFKCVSRAWRSLIGSIRFISKQLEESKRNSTFAHQRALLGLSSGELFECCVQCLFHKPDIHAVEFNFATIINVPIRRADLVGSCNGLVCILLNGEEFVLWNPSTRISKRLPNIIDENHTPRAYGFCFDEWSVDYKVVVITENEENEDYSAHMYSLKSDSWKITKNSPPQDFWVSLDRRGKLESRKLHWEIDEIIRKGARDEIVGLEFDLKREVFETAEECEACKFESQKMLKVHLDESSHVQTTFPSSDACTFMNNIRFLIICDHTFASTSVYKFEIYHESLETLDIYPQEGEELKV